MLDITDLSCDFDGLPVLNHIDMSIGRHEIVAIVGPSGCGKSTLLNIIAGTNDDYSGKIDTHGAKIGYVFQEDRIFPWMTVYENIKVVRNDTDEKRIHSLIHKMHLDGFADYFPDQLSGGMKQRCGIARAFYYGSDLLLMDEPFKSLDALLRTEMLGNLKDLWKEENCSVLFVTHDVEEALMIADRVIVLSSRPSRIVYGMTLERADGLRDVTTPQMTKIKSALIDALRNEDYSIEKAEVKESLEGMKTGIDIGASTVKIAVMNDGQIIKTWSAPHFGRILPTVVRGLKESEINGYTRMAVTGTNSAAVKNACSDMDTVEDIPAIIDGVRYMMPQAGSIIEIGSQSAKFITNLDRTAPRFAVNEHCAGGTGSFFEDQMNRIGMKIEDYSDVVSGAKSVPRLSGRCSVFAKTDIIHRQQEGVPTADILLGLCYAMIRNYRATIVKDIPVRKPVVFCGGVTKNVGVEKAIKEVFELSDDELIIPQYACFDAAVGAAVNAESECLTENVISELENAKPDTAGLYLNALDSENTKYTDPMATHIIPAGGVNLGIDIGSTSTDLVLTDTDGNLVDFQYLRTRGNPERAVRRGLAAIKERYGEIKFNSVGVTGSGRERIGRMIGADAVRDEITAQARGASENVEGADTVFEIGGQDSKFISLKDGRVVDFEMNKICAAGTGSFVEEQAGRMGIPIDRFGEIALSAQHPAQLGERCTVFIETAIASASAEGVGQADIAAGLCHSIVRNYLTKVVGTKHVGEKIALQGGICYNPGIVAAFRTAYGDKITVNPYFSISGAYGVSLLAAESMAEGAESKFRGYDFSSDDKASGVISADVKRNIDFYNKAGELLLDGYTGEIDPSKKTVGVPYVLMIHKFFPMANAYFKALGYNVLLTKPTDEDTIRLSQQLARGETCYPVKLIYGHVQQLVDAGVDYIFLPSIHTMKHEKSHVAHNYGCVYMQTAPDSIARAMKLSDKGIEMLSPVFDLDFGQQAMAGAMVSMGVEKLHKPKPMCLAALISGSGAVKKHTAAVEELGKQLLSNLSPDDKVLVLITRNYGVSDPILNMGIPQMLLERGCKVITLSHLPAHSLDISQDHQNLFWPFGQHIISGAKIIAKHPNLYAVYLTNHGCGPDTMLQHLFKEEMGDKPYLQIEVDEHFSKVGVVTRIEAFLNSISARPSLPVPKDYRLEDVNLKSVHLPEIPSAERTVAVPDFGLYSDYIAQYIESQGYRCELLPHFGSDMLRAGREITQSKEYIPFAAYAGEVIADMNTAKEKKQYIIPCTRGAEADGQYSRAIKAELMYKGRDADIVSPMLETLPEKADFDLLCRAIATGDILYAAKYDRRSGYAPKDIPSWEQLKELAEKVSRDEITGKRIAAIGDPIMTVCLDDGVLSKLESEGETILRQPLLEYLWMMWNDQDERDSWKDKLDSVAAHMTEIGAALGDRNTYASDMSLLVKTADSVLPRFTGSNGRYRYAKVMDIGHSVSAVLHMTPRYENTAMVLDMRGLSDNSPAPLFRMAMDGDWDESAWARLRSFLHYCRDTRVRDNAANS